MKFKIILILLLWSFNVLSYCQIIGSADLRPASKTPVVKHTYYSLEYSETHEQALWVYYTLTPNYINGTAKRKDNFKSDPRIATGSAALSDYKGSGYDRGHLCPAAAMKINQSAMDDSFYMSNMSPQEPSFNRGRWKQLEEQVRNWVLWRVSYML